MSDAAGQSGENGSAKAGAPAPRRLELNVTSDPANLAAVRVACEKFSAGAGLGETAVGEVGLCVNEAMANVTRHAYGGATDRPVRLTAEELPAGGAGTGTANGTGAANGTGDGRRAGVRISIRDWGSGVNPAALPPKPRDPLRPGGLGLICLRELMDEVDYAPQPDGMLLTMVKRRREGVRCEDVKREDVKT